MKTLGSKAKLKMLKGPDIRMNMIVLVNELNSFCYLLSLSFNDNPPQVA